jgi:prevent-host-death family protein
MRITVGMHEAKTHFSRLVRQANDGDDVVVENNGAPVARIVPYVEALRRRKGGLAKGKIWMSPDCWDPDPDLERLFYEGDL